MRSQPLDLIGGFYQDDSLPWACQDTVNWIPEAAEAQGTRTPSILRDAPGLRPSVQVGTGPIRGMRNVEGKLLVVSGTQLYQISNDLVAIPRGTIPGTGRVSMAHNSRSGGNQVTIVNGNAGYVYDTNALTLTRITDAGYPGAFVVDFVDGYMAQIEPLRRYWFHSELTQALDYNTLDRYPAEGQPDALVTLLVDHREVWVFGERTIEPFVNVGAATNTFQRASNTVIENGCSAKFSPAKLDNSIFWLDELGIVRRAQGYTATRISTSAIEKAIADLDWSRAFGFTITDRGHAIYYLTFPDGYTFGYDLVTGLWHRRASYGLDRWRVAAIAYWNGAYMCGDFQQGLLYALDWDYPYDGVLPHVRERVTGVTHDNQTRVLVPYVELIVDNGRQLVASVEAPDQPDGPSITGNAPNGSVGMAYSYAYTPTGGEAPLVVALAPGSTALPDGLTLSSAGVLSGTPTTLGAYSWTVRVTDANGLYDDLADSADIASGSWLFGPVNQNGVSGGSTDYYLRASTPAALPASTPVAIPSPMSGIGRISVANGLVFLHNDDGSQNAQVSSDGGITWTECDDSLYSAAFGVLDVYWNGAFYYWANIRSADGITWGAIPNFPAVTVDAWYARESDGLYLVAATNGNIYTTLDDGATAFTTRTSPFGGATFSAFESNGTRIYGGAAGGIGVGYSDDAFATAATASATGAGSYKKFASTVWLGQRVAGFIKRSTDGTAWADSQATVTYMANQHFIDYGNSTFAFCDTTAANTHRIYSSADAGAPWTDRGLVYGPGASIAFVEVMP